MNRKSLITHRDPKSPASEAYRMIRTNLEYSQVDERLQTILFTSSMEAEGKSTSLSNVAIALAHSGFKVLIIECDLRKPRLHKIFRLKRQPGLTNYLVKDLQTEDIVQQETGIKGLHVVTAGPVPPLASELLGSKRFRQLLSQFKTEYDYVLIDSPPLLSVTDGGILSGLADGTILCVAQGETPVDAVKTALKSLRKANAHVLGAIMTKAERKQGGFYAYHYYAYEYNQEEENKPGLFDRIRQLRHRI